MCTNKQLFSLKEPMDTKLCVKRLFQMGLHLPSSDLIKWVHVDFSPEIKPRKMSDHIYLHVWNTTLRLSRSSQCYSFWKSGLGMEVFVDFKANPESVCFGWGQIENLIFKQHMCLYKFSAPANEGPSLFPIFRRRSASKLSLKGERIFFLDFMYSILLARYRCGIALTVLRMKREIKYHPVKDDCIAYCQTRSFESERGTVIIMPGC